MPVLARLNRLLRRTKSAAPDDLARFVAGRGAYLAQKTIIDYCAVKLGVNWHAALHDPVFTEPLNICRWRTYLAAQGDVVLLVEAWLRPNAADPALLLAPLAAMAETAIRTADVPPRHLEEAETAIAAIPPRLARAQLGPAHAPTELPLAAGPVLLESLPIHENLRKGETVAILGALRMHLVSAQEDLERMFEPRALAAALSAGARAA